MVFTTSDQLNKSLTIGYMPWSGQKLLSLLDKSVFSMNFVRLFDLIIESFGVDLIFITSLDGFV